MQRRNEEDQTIDETQEEQEKRPGLWSRMRGRATGTFDTVTGLQFRKEFEDFTDAVTTTVVGVHRDQGELRSQVTDVQREQTELQGRVRGVRREQTELRSQVADVQQTQTELQGRVRGVRREQKELRSQVTDVQQEQTELQSRVAGVQREQTELQVRVTGEQKEREELRARLEKLEAEGRKDGLSTKMIIVFGVTSASALALSVIALLRTL